MKLHGGVIFDWKKYRLRPHCPFVRCARVFGQHMQLAGEFQFFLQEASVVPICVCLCKCMYVVRHLHQ